MQDAPGVPETEISEIMTFRDGDPAENPWVRGTPVPETAEIVPYSADWPRQFEDVRRRIIAALPQVAIAVEHIGSTAVPGMAAKPVIDVDLIVADPDREADYVPALAADGFVLSVRELTWYRHRMLRLEAPRVNLHVFGPACAEHARHVLFRDWLRDHEADRELYARAKRRAREGARTVESYNKNKKDLIRDIYRRIFEARGWAAPAGR